MAGLLDPKKYVLTPFLGEGDPAGRAGPRAALGGGREKEKKLDTADYPAPSQDRPGWPRRRIRHRLPMETYVLGLTALFWIGLALASPFFLTTGNVINIMRQVSTDAILAYGELFPIILAGIDLSVGRSPG